MKTKSLIEQLKTLYPINTIQEVSTCRRTKTEYLSIISNWKPDPTNTGMNSFICLVKDKDVNYKTFLISTYYINGRFERLRLEEAISEEEAIMEYNKK